MTLAAIEDRKHMPKTVVIKLPEIFDSWDANKSVQPVEARLSTMMKNPMRKGTIFHGILDEMALMPERCDTTSCKNITIAKNRAIVQRGTPVQPTGKLIQRIVHASTIEPNKVPVLFLRARRGSISGVLNSLGILRRKTSQSEKRQIAAAKIDGRNIHFANSTKENP